MYNLNFHINNTQPLTHTHKHAQIGVERPFEETEGVYARVKAGRRETNIPYSNLKQEVASRWAVIGALIGSLCESRCPNKPLFMLQSVLQCVMKAM